MLSHYKDRNFPITYRIFCTICKKNLPFWGPLCRQGGAAELWLGVDAVDEVAESCLGRVAGDAGAAFDLLGIAVQEAGVGPEPDADPEAAVGAGGDFDGGEARIEGENGRLEADCRGGGVLPQVLPQV